MYDSQFSWTNREVNDHEYRKTMTNSVKILPIDFFEDHCIWAALFLLENVPNNELEYS